MNVVQSIKEFLMPPMPHSSIIAINSASDYEHLPKGFFRCETASGEVSCAYNGSFLCWKVGKTVVDGSERLTCETPLDELPRVYLHFQQQQHGVQNISGTNVIETDALDSWDGETRYDGQPNSGVAWQ